MSGSKMTIQSSFVVVAAAVVAVKDIDMII